MSIIQVQSLTKKYGDNPVLKGISFSVTKGEIFALLGTNGAGKTTTLECIEGLRKYDSGKIEVNGKLGVQLQSSSLPENIKIIEALTLFSKWNHVPVDNETIKRLDLDSIQKMQYKELSMGQRRRLHLAIALIGDPEIIILDEPTAGLDVEGRFELHTLIKELKQRGKTIVMSSHDMAEVEELCDRIAILRNGNIVFTGKTFDLINSSHNTWRIQLKATGQIKTGQLIECSKKNVAGEYQVFEISNLNKGLLELISLCNNNKIEILDLQIEHDTLERRFVEIAKEGKE